MQPSIASSKLASRPWLSSPGRGSTGALHSASSTPRERVSPHASSNEVGNGNRGATLLHIPKKAKLGGMSSNDSSSGSSSRSGISSSSSGISSSSTGISSSSSSISSSSGSRKHNSSGLRSIDPRRRKSSSISIDSSANRDSSCDPEKRYSIEGNEIDSLKISAPWRMSDMAPMAEKAKTDGRAESVDIERKMVEIDIHDNTKAASLDQRRQQKQQMSKLPSNTTNAHMPDAAAPTWIGVVKWPSKTHLYGVLKDSARDKCAGKSSLLGPFDTALAAALAHDYAALSAQAAASRAEAHDSSRSDARSSVPTSEPAAAAMNFPDLGLCAKCSAFTVPEGSFLALDVDPDVVAAAKLPGCGLLSSFALNQETRHDSTTLLCDGCDAETHFTCSGLEALPEASHKWFCEDCSKAKAARKKAKQKIKLAKTYALGNVAVTAATKVGKKTSAMATATKKADPPLCSPPSCSLFSSSSAQSSTQAGPAPEEDEKTTLQPIPAKAPVKPPDIVRPVPRPEDWVPQHEFPPPRRTYYGAHSASSGLPAAEFTGRDRILTHTLERPARIAFDVGTRVCMVERRPGTCSPSNSDKTGVVVAVLTTNEVVGDETAAISYRVAFDDGITEDVAHAALKRVLDLATVVDNSIIQKSIAAPADVAATSAEATAFDQSAGIGFASFALQEHAKLPRHWPRVTQLRAVHRAWNGLGTAEQIAWGYC